MPVTLFDPKTGKPTVVDSEAAQAGVADGTLAPQNDQVVHVLLKDGRKGTVEGHELASTLADGARILDPEAEAHSAEVTKESGARGAFHAASLGVLEGASAGLGTGLVRKGIAAISPEAGKRFQGSVEAIREAHPYVHMAGNVVGAAGAAFASKGASEAGAIGGAASLAPAAIVDAVGGATERGIGGALAHLGGEGALATAGRTAAVHGARAGVESALFAAGQHVGEDMLGDHDTAADKLFIATAKGGAFGLGLGAALGGAGSLVRSARGAASKGGSAILGEAASANAAEAEQKLSAAQAAHEAASARAFSWMDLQGSPVEFNPGAEVTEAPAAEKAFEIRKGVQHATVTTDPDAGIAGETEDILGRNLGEKDALPRPLNVKAPEVFSTKASRRAALETGMTKDAMRTSEGGMSALEQMRRPASVKIGGEFSEGSGPMADESDVFGLKRTNDVHIKTGIEALEAPSADRPIGMPQEPEDLAVMMRRAAAEQDLKTAQSDFTKASKDAEDARHLSTLASEVKANDLHKLVDKFTWQETGADAAITKKVNKFAGGTERAGATMRRYGILDVGADSGAVKATFDSLSENTPEKMLGRTQSTLSRLVDEMHAIGGTKTSATLGEFLAPLDKQIAELSKVSTTVPVANRLMAQRAALLGTPKFASLLDVDGNLVPGALKSPVSLSDIISERRGVGRTAYAVGDLHANIIKEANSSLYQAWDKLEGEALDRAASAEGGVTGAKFKALKTDITDLINVEKALEGKVARASSARAFGVLPHMAGLAGGAAGGAVLPVGGHLIGHALAMMGAKSVMDRGNAAAAVALTKIADIGAVKSLMGTVDTAVERAAKGLTTPAETKTPKLRVVGGSTSRREEREPLATRYRSAIQKLDALEAQGSGVSERAMASTQDLAQHAPNVANSFSVAMSRATAYLSSKRPVPLMPADPYTNREPSILDSDKLSFVKSWEAGTNPMGILERFERGVVTPQDTEALKATAPTVYNELFEKVQAEVASRHAAGKAMPYKKRIELGLLFPDLKTDPSLEPATYKMLQGNVTQAAPPPPAPTGGRSNHPRQKSVKLPSQVNPLDRLAQNGAGRK